MSLHVISGRQTCPRLGCTLCDEGRTGHYTCLTSKNNRLNKWVQNPTNRRPCGESLRCRQDTDCRAVCVEEQHMDIAVENYGMILISLYTF